MNCGARHDTINPIPHRAPNVARRAVDRKARMTREQAERINGAISELINAALALAIAEHEASSLHDSTGYLYVAPSVRRRVDTASDTLQQELERT